MDQFLKPERFDVEPTCTGAEAKWRHWKRTFSNFIDRIPQMAEVNKLPLLCNYVSANVFRFINDEDSYDAALNILDSLYITKRNEIFARHCLASRSQQPGESVSDYLQILKQMSKDCEFKSVTAEQYKNEYVRDSFIRGLRSSRIRERLLENASISLETAFDQARALELAEQHAASYLSAPGSVPVAATEPVEDEHAAATSHGRSGNCFFCGNSTHLRSICPAKNAICRSCGKKGHYRRVCKSKPPREPTNASASTQLLASLCTVPYSLHKATTPVLINGIELLALIDTGSSLSFINERLVNVCKITPKPYTGRITMANSAMSSEIVNCGRVNIQLQDHSYTMVEVLIMKNLCADFLVGHDILKYHSTVEIGFKGDGPPLKICSLATACVQPVPLFSNLTPDCRPVVTKSRRHSVEDQKFISTEITRLLEEGVIEPSNSPWRAQVFVVRGDNYKPRMVVDYSQTINKFTLLDAYPLPRIEDLIARISKYEVFSRIDLKSAYHQVPILKRDMPYTAFEADGKLFHFLRIPFGVTNGVACFQRTIDGIVKDEGLHDTFPYLDDVTVCGKDQDDHDTNLQNFLAAAQKYNLTLNKDKCIFSTRSISLLGYIIEQKTIRPDPIRLSPLLDLPIPHDSASLKRALGMFAHHSRWIPTFSEKIRPLLGVSKFPLPDNAVAAFNVLKDAIANASLAAIEDFVPFRVETDASDFAIGATLSQAGRPIAFFSRTLNKSEQKHSAIEKEAYAIVDALRYWRHYLIGRHFEVLTDQRSVSFMFDQNQSNKIKNEKIMRWRMDLACYKFDIIYRPGSTNASADALSRIAASTSVKVDLKDIHIALCHPGITRMYHWVRSKNLPFSIEEVKSMTNNCQTCNELKPRFHRYEGKLIKATAPFERLNLDFKGPLPSSTRNRFLLTIVDEYSRFPFAIPCADTSASTIITHLQNIFSIFGMPAFIHSDRGSSFMSRELKTFLTSNGIATSRTTAFNPQGNGQVERYNGIIWKTVQLALGTSNLAINNWEKVLPSALHSIRSLLCTSTNATPHERMFSHNRRSHHGRSLPSWLFYPGPVLMKNQYQSNKYDSRVQKVQLLEVNPDYAFVRLPDGRETSVSLRHLAPCGDSSDFSPIDEFAVNYPETPAPVGPSANSEKQMHSIPQCSQEEIMSSQSPAPSESVPPCSSRTLDDLYYGTPERHTSRIRRRPNYLNDYVTD